MTSPDASFGSHSACWAGEPPRARAIGPSTTPMNGTGATAAPRASEARAASSSVRPSPPCSSGMTIPARPKSVIAFQMSPPLSVRSPANLRTRSSELASDSVRVRLSCIIFWSEVSEKSMAQAAAGFGSRGRPRPRSAMMFFWICAVPPPMIRPKSNM